MTPQEKHQLEELHKKMGLWESKADYLTTLKMFKELDEYFWNPEDEDEN